MNPSLSAYAHPKEAWIAGKIENVMVRRFR